MVAKSSEKRHNGGVDEGELSREAGSRLPENQIQGAGQMADSMKKKNSFFRKRIVVWYSKNRRELPWRDAANPYQIWVSEIMLQQTQVDRVRPKYRAFLEQFPTLRSLAAAPKSAVLSAWSGLGYNRRAVNLHRAAREIVSRHGGRFPRTVHELETLPGVGRYTASAIASFAFGVRVATVDTNHQRVIGRFFYGTKNAPKKKIEAKSSRLLSDPEWNHSLMDFGALVCKARPLCFSCPLRERCDAFPKVLTEKEVSRKNAERFFGSNRYVRGEIVRILTKENKHTISEKVLFHRLSDIPNVTPSRIRSLISALQKDGVVTRRGKNILLG